MTSSIRALVMLSVMVTMGSLCDLIVAQSARIIMRDWTRLTGLEVNSINVDGIVLTDEQIIAWDQLEDLTGSDEHREEFLRLQSEVGDDLFRARTRLERGEVDGAGPLCEAHVAKFQERDSRSARIILAGAAQYRISQGRSEDAVLPILALLSHLPISTVIDEGQASDETDFYELRSWGLHIDPATGFCDELLPIWFDETRAREVLPEVLKWYESQGETLIPASSIYVASLASHAGEFERAKQIANQARPVSADMNELAQIVDWQIMLQREPNSSLREIETNLDNLLPRNQALILYWRGTAGLKSRDKLKQQEALLSLLRVPAQWPRFHQLAAACLFAAQQGLASLGDAEGQAKLIDELRRRYSDTPFIERLNGP